METKLFEVRDKGTFVPVLCVLMESVQPKEVYLLGRCGYRMGNDLVLYTPINSDPNKSSYDCHSWGYSRTHLIAHDHITKNWGGLSSGDVIDVEFILNKTQECKKSEAFYS